MQTLARPWAMGARIGTCGIISRPGRRPQVPCFFPTEANSAELRLGNGLVLAMLRGIVRAEILSTK